MSSKAREIEEAKKIAVGQRLLVQTETEARRREQTRLQYMLLETKAHTQRSVRPSPHPSHTPPSTLSPLI